MNCAVKQRSQELGVRRQNKSSGLLPSILTADSWLLTSSLTRRSAFGLRPLLMFACLALTTLILPAATRGAEAGDDPPGAAPGVNVSAATTTTTREGRLQIFDDVWEAIRERYYDPKLHGVNWQEIGARFRPLAADARDSREFYRVMRRLVARLGDAHTRIYAPGERSTRLQPFVVSVGVSVREVAGMVVVTNVERGSTAEQAGVRAGDKVTSVDGEAAALALDRYLEEHVEPPNTEAAARQRALDRLRAVAKLFDGPADSSITIVLAKSDGREQSVRLRRARQRRQDVFDVRRVGGGYSVVRFDAFTPELATAFVRTLKGELRNARGLILDLRDNGGGEMEVMVDVASAFLPAGLSLGQFTDRGGHVRVAPQTRAAPLFTADAGVSFRGPVVVLAGAKTASAAEIFTRVMQTSGRAEVLGEHTCGCVLGVRRPHQLPDGGQLDISELNYHTADGARLEKVGIEPDETLAPLPEDIGARRDRTLERALEQLKAKGNRR